VVVSEAQAVAAFWVSRFFILYSFHRSSSYPL
jgi:hypothetical protein